MNARLAPTGRPTWAIIAWIDDNHIYAEIPSSMGRPYITKFPITEGGLSQALNFLRTRYEVVPTEERNYTKAPEVKYRGQKAKVQTDEQRAMALKVLRDKGIL